MNTKAFAIIAVAVLVAAGAGVAIYATEDKNKEKTGGLYDLKAIVYNVDMGGVTATPNVVSAIESLYTTVYGDLPDKEYTIAEVKADAEFWEKYCKYKPLVVKNSDGTFTVKTKVGAGKAAKNIDVTIKKIDHMISMGSMYMTTIYNLLCEKHKVKPYSQEALDNADLKKDFQSLIAAGTSLEYIKKQTDLFDYFDPSTYLDAKKNSLGDYDKGLLGQHVKTILEKDPGSNLVLMGSGSHIDMDVYNDFNNIVKTGGDAFVPLSGSKIKEAFASIECLGVITGLEEYSVPLLENLQKRLYAVYMALKSEPREPFKVYWEASTGKALSGRGTSKDLMEFMRWDSSLMDGQEKDLETLLQEKPDMIIFYSNDTRPEEVKMRVSA